MTKNELTTKFIFDEKDGVQRIELAHSKLIALNNDFNNLGKDTIIGKTIADNFDAAGKSVDNFKNKVNETVSKPTISRYWEAEEQKTAASLKNIEAAIIKTKTVTGNPGADSRNRISGLRGITETATQPQISVSPVLAEIDGIQKKAEAARDALAKIAGARVAGRQMDNLTKEMDAARARAVSLTGDIISIKKELANPNRKSSVKFLTDELAAAEAQADKLNRKLSVLPKSSSAAAGDGKSLKFSSFQKQNLFYQANDVATMAALGANPGQIIVSQAGQIAQIPTAAQATALVAAYGSLVTILGAGAAAIALTYKITGDIRVEAEKRLKVETMISAEGNKQALSQKQALKDFQQLRKEAELTRNFSASLQTGTIDGLRNRRATLEKIVGIDSTSDTSKRFQNEILQIDAQIVAIQERSAKLADEAFNQRNENFKKSQNSSIEFEQKSRTETEKRTEKGIEKGKEKVVDLGKIYKSVLDDISKKSNSDNPFAAVFAESRNELEKLKESLRGLPEEMRRAAIQAQQAINKNKLFESRIDNNLSILDLRDRASELRSVKTPKPTEEIFNNVFDDYVKKQNEKIRTAYALDSTLGGNRLYEQNPFVSYNSSKFADGSFGGFTRTDVRDNLFTAFDQVSGFGTLRRERSFRDLSDTEKRILIDKFKTEDENTLSLNQKLNRQINVINSGVTTDSERGIADRRLIGLTSGLDPAQIKTDLREQIAAANEREAVRKEKYESELLRVQKEDLEISKRIANAQEKLLKIAEKDGLDGLNKFLEITVRDETRSGIDTGKAGSDADVRRTYFDEAN